MPHVVVVGGGPIGLYMAAKLKQLGVDVVVVDHRLGEATRPGQLDAAIFLLLSRELNLPVNPSASRHIKDVERELYKINEKLGVQLIKKKFVRLVPGGIELENASKKSSIKDTKDVDEKLTVESIACHYVFDATGPARSVLESVNAVMKDKIFSAQPVVDNPMKHNFIAYVRIDEKASSSLTKPLAAKSDPLWHTLALESLRSQFGWQEYDEPYLQSIKLNKEKVCLYLTTPPNLAKDKEEAWVRAVLRLKTGNPDIDFQQIKPSRKYQMKPRFLPFIVNPKKVNKLIWVSDKGFPVILPIGDAQIEPDYRIGIGVRSGVLRTNAFLASIKIDKNKEMIVDVERYERELAPFMIEHCNALTKFYIEMRDKLIRARNVELDRYMQALLQTKSDDQRILINQSILALVMCRLDHIKKLYFNLLNLENTAFQLDAYHDIKSEIHLEEVIKDLKKLIGIILPQQVQLKHDAKLILLDVANKCRDLAKIYFADGNSRYHDCEKFFKIALAIYKTYFSVDVDEEVKKIHSNLVLVAYKRGHYVEAIAYADVGLAHIEKAPMTASLQSNANQVLIVKMAFYKCLSMLELVSKEADSKIAKINLGESTKIAGFLLSNSKLNHLDKAKITEALEKCRKKFGLEQLNPLSASRLFSASAASLLSHRSDDKGPFTNKKLIK